MQKVFIIVNNTNTIYTLLIGVNFLKLEEIFLELLLFLTWRWKDLDDKI